MYKIIADLHTHTLASTHAFSTVAEMLKTAKDKGLYAIAITDHGKAMPGAPGEYYFEAMANLPLMNDGVKLITGQEANIVDFDGTIDYRPSDDVNFVIASVHNIPHVSLQNATVEKCTQMYLNVAKNKYVNAIGHSGSKIFKYDYEKVIPEFKKNNKIVEINARSFLVRGDVLENCIEIARVCKECGAMIMVSSDAHYHAEVGSVDKAFKVLEAVNFPEDLILNASVERLEEYLNKYTNINENRRVLI